MAKVIGIKYTPTTTGWETIFATEAGVPNGTEAIISDIIATNQTGGNVDVDLAIVESADATPTATDLIVEATTVNTNTIADIDLQLRAGTLGVPLSAGQVMKVKVSAVGPAFRVFGRKAAEGFVLGAGPISS